jgi:N-acetylglucosamine-6-phosphate deacetylase
MIALTAATLFTPMERIGQPLLLIEDGVIRTLSARASSEIAPKCRIVDLKDAILAPGLFDIHIHGGAGHDIMESNPAALPALERLLVRHGVSSYFPTTVTAPLEETLAALARLAKAVETARNNHADEPRAVPLGIHLEGPFISHTRRGVHPPQDLLPPTVATFTRFWEAARGQIRVMTIAPELPGAPEVIAEAARRGVCVSLGHSNADLNSTRAAVAAGARHATHTFNAMRPLSHRDPGILAEVLTDTRVSADIIADGVHVDPAVVNLFLKAKGADAAVLITDATAATGMPAGRYRLGSCEVEVKDGKSLIDGKLAGSILTMDRAVRNVMQYAHWDLQKALRLATVNPARVAGLKDHGILKEGVPADLVVLSPTGEVRKTIVRGVGI